MMRVRMSELELHDLGDEVWDELQPRAEVAVRKGVWVIVERARSLLARRRGTAKTSAPAGEPPEMDTGELRDSVRPGRVRLSKYGVSQDYGSDHPSAGLHEFGGLVKQGNTVRRYPARSYIRAAEEQVRDEVDKRLEAV